MEREAGRFRRRDGRPTRAQHPFKRGARHPPTPSSPRGPARTLLSSAGVPRGGRRASSKATRARTTRLGKQGMATRSSKARHRSEASAPATSVAVAAARAQDAPKAPLRRSAAFPPRRSHSHPQPHPHGHQRCDSEPVSRSGRQPRCGEVAGGTAAGCAAVCCCFPCVMVEVVVLATVRAPAALCRRAVRARRRRRSASAGQAVDMYELLVEDGTVAEPGDPAVVWPAGQPAEDAGDMEKEVWSRFYGAGFWRSPSQLGDEIR
ncbi:uncharacterized protein LOC123398159 [Hordeum vulgare subsp. vulgare]|uniref:uncharacterized protein LOC123398159 n=1 Tax=Hordeum vulgare subsp. vulgare TaxID=112509 RepID=UPI00162C6261|nr:uncharacterized protein LOC123398159 [Hordeum vulgare subsp. vulgare]